MSGIAASQPSIPAVGGPLPFGVTRLPFNENFNVFQPDGAGNYGLILASQPLGSVSVGLAFDSWLAALHGSFTSVTNPTTFLLVARVRDATIEPSVTLAQAIAASGYVAITTPTSVTAKGDFYAAIGTQFYAFTPGSNDDYGNAIKSGDTLVLDLVVYCSNSSAQGTFSANYLFGTVAFSEPTATAAAPPTPPPPVPSPAFDTANQNTGSGPVSVTISPSAANELIVVFVQYNAGGGASGFNIPLPTAPGLNFVTDIPGNGVLQSNNVGLAAFHAMASGTGPYVITVNYSDGGPHYQLGLTAIAVLNTSKFAGYDAIATGTGVGTIPSVNIVTTQANDFLLAAVNGGGQTAGSGWTLDQLGDPTDEYSTAPTPGSYDAAFSSATTWAMIVVAISPGGL